MWFPILMRLPHENYCILKKLQNLTRLTSRGRAEKWNNQQSLERTKGGTETESVLGKDGSPPDPPHGIINVIWKEYLGNTKQVFLLVKWVNHWRNLWSLWKLENWRILEPILHQTPAAVGITEVTSEDEPKVQSFMLRLFFLEQKPWQTKQGKKIFKALSRDIYCQIQKMTHHKKLVKILNMSLYLL